MNSKASVLEEASVVPMPDFASKHVADIVELLNEEDVAEAAAQLDALPVERAALILDQPELRAGSEIIAAIDLRKAALLFNAMSADRATDLFRDLDEPVRSHLFARLDTQTKATLRKLLAFPENTAGSLMTTEFVSVPSHWSIANTLQHIRVIERTRETVYAIYILDAETGRLVQAVSLRSLIVGAPEANILTAAPRREPVTVPPDADRDEVARTISKYDLLAVPVVDDTYHVIGIVTVDDVIDAMVESTTEDVQKLGGTVPLAEPYVETPFGEMLRKRAGWLCILFVSEMLTASAMQYFQSELEKALVLTLFIPLIMSSGGNSGSQATSLLIRALALGEVKLRDWWRVAVRELPAGLALGAILGVLGVARIAAWQLLGLYDYGPMWPLVALTIALALVGVVTFGSLTGSMLPFALQRVGFDPASASAPFVATLVDVMGLIIYFTVALLVLRGSLL